MRQFLAKLRRKERINNLWTDFILQENTGIILNETKYGFANQKSGMFKGREVRVSLLWVCI